VHSLGVVYVPLPPLFSLSFFLENLQRRGDSKMELKKKATKEGESAAMSRPPLFFFSLFFFYPFYDTGKEKWTIIVIMADDRQVTFLFPPFLLSSSK